jgi:hypothetical protein
MEYIPLWEDNIRLPNQESACFLWTLKDRYSESGPHRPILFLYDPPIPSDLLPSPKILYFSYIACVKTCSHSLSNI